MSQVQPEPNLRYRRLFETARDGILILDFVTGKVEDANPSCIQMLGYAMEELVGKELGELDAMLDQNAAIRAVAVLKKDGFVRYDDLPLRTKAGNIISVEFVSNAYAVNGEHVIQCNLRDITGRKTTESELLQFHQEAVRNMYSMVNALNRVIVARDAYTYQHQVRVAHLAAAIATEMDLSLHTVEGIRQAALIHDIGKMTVPAEILTKPVALNSSEIEMLQRHVQAGYDMVKDIDFQWPIAQIIYQHHCRLDGSGYPNHLKGDSIIPEARILAVADTAEAMSHNRPYRPSLGLESALAHLVEGKGRLYDATAVDACVKLFKQDGYRFPELV